MSVLKDSYLAKKFVVYLVCVWFNGWHCLLAYGASSVVASGLQRIELSDANSAENVLVNPEQDWLLNKTVKFVLAFWGSRYLLHLICN